MKFIKVLIFLLISANSYGQFYTNINTSIYWKQPSGFDKVFIGNDTFQITDNSKRWIAIKNAVMYFHDGTKWTAISGGGSGGSFTLPQADSNTLGGIRYNTDLALDANNRLGIAPGKKALWNTIANLPLFYATGDSTRRMMHDTALAHDYVFGSDFTVTGRNVSVNFPAQLTDTYGSSIWPGLTEKPAVWDAKTDYSEFLDSIASVKAIRRDSIFFNRADFLGSGTSLSPISLASNTDVSSTETGLIKPGYVTWSGTGYTYDVTPAIYRVNGLYYTSSAGSVTLDAADGALNRIDAVVVDTFGAVSKITGVAASNPVAPIPNPSSQVVLTNITVTPGSSAPSTLNTIVYNEEGNGEYTGSSSGVTSNTANTTFPFSGAKSDNIGAWTSGSTVTFTNGTTASATSYTYLKFFIRLKGIVQNATSISVIFYNGTTPVSKLVSIVNYGINKSLVGSYQNVSVPFSVFGFTSNQFNKIQFRFGGPDGPGCYLDFVQLQNSAVTETGSNALTDVFLKSDSLFKTVGGNSLFVGKVGGSGGVATDTTSLSSRINAKLNISDAATTYFPLTGGTLTGTAGNGYVGFNPQSSTPSTPTSGFRLFATNPGAFAWITSQGYARELRVRAQTQNNIYYLQDKSYTLADSADVAGKVNIVDTASMLNGYPRKTNTISINGNTQTLGSNPSFTISSGGSGTDSLAYHTISILPDSSGATFNTPSGKKDTLKVISQPVTVSATGDATGVSNSSGTAITLPLTLPTVNTNVGTFSNATVTVDAKGRVTAASAGSGGAGAAGSNTQIQFNSSGSLGGSANFTFDGSTNKHVLAGTPTIATKEASSMYINPTLTAAANNDTLNALTLGPSFSTGALTGVKKNAIRILPNGLFRKDYYTGSVNATLLMGSKFEMDGTSHASGGFIFAIRPGAEGTNNLSAGYGVDIGDATTYMRVSGSAITLNSTSVTLPNTNYFGGGTSTTNSPFYTVSSTPYAGFKYPISWNFGIQDASGNKLLTANTSGNIIIDKTTGTPTDVPNSRLTVNSTLQGALPYPRMTTAQRDALYYVNTNLVITNGGSGYTLGTTTVAVTGGGSPTTSATVTVTAVTGGVITAATVTTTGANYSTTPTATVSSTSGGTGAVITLSLSPLTEGLTIYNLTTHQTEYWNGTAWVH